MEKYNPIKLGLLTLCIATSQSRSAETVLVKLTTMAGEEFTGKVECLEDGLFCLPGKRCVRILNGLTVVKTLEECRDAMEKGAGLTAVYENAEISTWPFQTQSAIYAGFLPFKNRDGLEQAKRLVDILNAAELTYEAVKATPSDNYDPPMPRWGADGQRLKQWCFCIRLYDGEYGQDGSEYIVEMARSRYETLFRLVWRAEGWYMHTWGTKNLVRMPQFVLDQISNITHNRLVLTGN